MAPPAAFGFSLGALGGLGQALYELGRQRRADTFADMKLLADQGTFVPVAESDRPPQTFLQRLFGGGLPEGYYDVGDRTYRFRPYETLGEEGARSLGLTTPVTETYAPLQHLPLDNTPAGPLFQTLPTPSTITTDTVSPAIAKLRLTPKVQQELALEKLKSDALDRRQEALAEARAERVRLLAQKDPSSVARLKWIATGLDSDDEDIQSVAQAELDRLRAPGKRADTAAAKLDQDYDIAMARLDARAAEVDKRLKAAQAAGDQRAALQAQRAAAALDRLRERLAAGGTSGKGASAGEDMPIDEAIATLQDYRKRPYFPGQSADRLTALENVITKFKADGKTSVGPMIAGRLRRLGQQLDNAQRRERVAPGPQPTPQSPAPGAGGPAGTGSQQPATTSSLPTGTFSTSDPGPSSRMVDAFRTFYAKLSPEEAEQDLRASIQADPLARALVTQAKARAYTTLYPQRPLQLQGPAAQPTAPAPAPTTPAAPERLAPVTPPEQGRAQVPQAAQQTPQAQVIERYMQFYASMNAADLAQEAARLAKSDPTGMDILTSYRAQAVQRVRQARQDAAALKATQPPAEVPAPPAQTTPQQALTFLRGKYQHLSSDELRAEARRLMASDPLGKSVPTSLRLSVVQQILAQRQAGTPARTPAADEEP